MVLGFSQMPRFTAACSIGVPVSSKVDCCLHQRVPTQQWQAQHCFLKHQRAYLDSCLPQ